MALEGVLPTQGEGVRKQTGRLYPFWASSLQACCLVGFGSSSPRRLAPSSDCRRLAGSLARKNPRATEGNGAMSSEPMVEDEFGARDELGLTAVTEKTQTEAQAYSSYMKMLLLRVPLFGQVLAWSLYFLAKYALGMKHILDAKFDFIKANQLGYVFLALWLVGITRTYLAVCANAARAGARLDRPDQHVYKVMASSGPMKDAPYVLMATTGPAGRFNRAQRAAFNADESMPLFLAYTLVTGCIFGPLVLVPLLIYCYGRILFGIKYTQSLSARGAGFMPAVIGEKWMEGLVLMAAIRALLM
ncbi:unnamed protein product [Effrenium voratum]|nr:unnamed protein product [Effrenium voratum]